MQEQSANSDPVLACDITAIDPAYREQHIRDIKQLFASIEEIQELPTGYGFRLPVAALRLVADFIEFERLCCPFFTFMVEVEPNHGALWLRLTGSEQIKEFIKVEFSDVFA